MLPESPAAGGQYAAGLGVGALATAEALSRWYRTRFGTGRRARRIGIVAVARKLVIALWRYATTGVVPAGAILKTA